MRNIKTILLVGGCALAIAACSPKAEVASSAIGDWKIDPMQSTLAFTTVKKGTVAEAHRFKTVNGTVAADGTAKVSVDLSSVDTGEEQRDSRMKEFLFEITKFPSAEITAKLDPAKFDKMALGERRVEEVPLTVNLHGKSLQVDSELYVTRVGNDKMLVETVKPLVLDGEDFDLLPGIEKLRQLVEIDAITPAAPVSFSVMLTR